MKKTLQILLISTLMLISTPVLALNPSNLSSLILNKPMVYKPSKLVIGQDNKFIVKAKPFSDIILITSTTSAGAPKYMGQDLRLGEIIDTIKSKTTENGTVEINLLIPDNKSLIGSSLYFEVLILDNTTNTASIAQVMSPASRESALNVISIYDKPKNYSMPSLDPLVPGLTDNVNNVINGKPIVPEEDGIKDIEMQYSRFTPAIIRNLKAVDKDKK